MKKTKVPTDPKAEAKAIEEMKKSPPPITARKEIEKMNADFRPTKKIARPQ